MQSSRQIKDNQEQWVHPEQQVTTFEEHLREQQEAASDEFDLVHDYEEAKQDHMCAADLRKIDVGGTTNQHVAKKEYSDVLVIVTGGTLTMVSTDHGYQPLKGLAERLKAYKTFYDREICEQEGVDDDTLITPVGPFGTRIRFKVHEFETLIDSSCVDIVD